ncbi:MAG: proton-conducting transporter membrane subunit [Planctomycetota bacterium]
MSANAVGLLAILPLCAGLAQVLLVGHRKACRAIGVVSLLGILGLALAGLLTITPSDPSQAAGLLVSQSGDWAAPYGITLAFDSLSGVLIAAASAVALGAYLHSFSSLAYDVERRYFHALVQMLMFGVNLSFLTGDLFNLFVGFEVMLMASYGLVTLGTTRTQMRQAYKYVLLNVLAGSIFLMAAGMVYGMTGTLNLADLARMVAEAEASQKAFAAGAISAEQVQTLPTGFTPLAVLLLMVFALKGGFFPLWFWLPDTYPTLPIGIAGLFGGLLTKVGVYAVARTFPAVFASDGLGGSDRALAWILVVAAAFTMFFAVLGAVSQGRVRRILAVHVISQVGYMVFGLAIALWVPRALAVEGSSMAGLTVAAYAMAGCVFYMVQHMVVKCSLFLCCGIMEMHAGTDKLDNLGGLLKRDTTLAVLFFIAAMSLVGLPPLSGFFGKMVIIQAGWRELWPLSVLGLLTGALTLLSMLKIWSYGFWNPPKAPVVNPPERVRSQGRSAYGGAALLVGLALFLGFGAELVYRVALQAGTQIMDRRPYIEAVLGEQGLDAVRGYELAVEQLETQAEPAVADQAPIEAETERVALSNTPTPALEADPEPRVLPTLSLAENPRGEASP